MNIKVRVKTSKHDARVLEIPKQDKTATLVVFGSPYVRVRKDQYGLYINKEGKRQPVAVEIG